MKKTWFGFAALVSTTAVGQPFSSSAQYPLEVGQGNGMVLAAESLSFISGQFMQIVEPRFYVQYQGKIDKDNAFAIAATKKQAAKACKELLGASLLSFTTRADGDSPVTFRQARNRYYYQSRVAESISGIVCSK